MEPLIALVAVTLGALIVNGIWIRRADGLQVALRAGILAMFVLSGASHFVGMRAELIDMVPAWVPQPALIITVTGVLELAGALGMLVRPLVPWAGAGLSLLLLVLFPANVSLALSDADLPWWDELVPRSVIQTIFLAATVAVTVLAVRSRRSESRRGLPRR